MTGAIAQIRGAARASLLWCGATLGSVCIVAALAAMVFDVKPLIFRSGSMAPAIETGSLGLARPASAHEIEVGDVISVVNSESVRVTHRVVDVEPANEGVLLQLQGDANATPDAQMYPVTEADRVFASIPHAGYAVAWVSGPAGIFAGGVLVGALLLVAFRSGKGRRRRPGPAQQKVAGADSDPGAERTGLGTEERRLLDEDQRADARAGTRKRRYSRRAGAAVAATLTLGLHGGASSENTQANWTDQATAQGGTLSGHTLITPTTHGCTNQGTGLIGGGFVRTTWTNADTRYGYRAELYRVDTVQRVGNIVDVPPQTGSQVTADFTMSNLSPGSGLRNYNLRIYSRLPNTTWVSTTFHTIPVRTATVLGLGTSIRCGHS